MYLHFINTFYIHIHWLYLPTICFWLSLLGFGIRVMLTFFLVFSKSLCGIDTFTKTLQYSVVYNLYLALNIVQISSYAMFFFHNISNLFSFFVLISLKRDL